MEGGRLWELLMVTNSTVDIVCKYYIIFYRRGLRIYMYMYKSTTISAYAMCYSELTQEVSKFI